jgi:hypothetical protein
MSPSSLNQGGRNAIQIWFGLLDSLIDANGRARTQFYEGLRQRVGRYPLLDAGIEYARAVSQQQRELGHAVIHEVERAFVTWGGSPAPPSAQQEDGVRASTESHHDTPEPPPAPPHSAPIRISVPVGKRAIAVPLHLRNHRSSTDIVSFSAALPSTPSVAVIPLHLIRFEPQTLAVSPQSDAAGQLLLDLATELQEDTEYWVDIVVTGAEIRRIPLILEVVSGTA